MEEETNISQEEQEDEKDLLPVDTLDEDSEALLTPEERIKRRSALQPDISWLKPAIVDGKFIPEKNDYIVVEMYSVLDDRHPWLDTRVYQLIKEPGEDGFLKLYDHVRGQCAAMNWKTGVDAGYEFKLPPSGRNPETLFESASGRRRRFEKPAYIKKFEQEVLENKISSDDSPPEAPEKRKGRGRPPGSKNRPKEVIIAERQARREELRAKKAKRASRA